MKPSPYLVHGAILTVSLIYAANYSIMKTVTPEFIDPKALVIIRVVSAAILFWLIAPREKLTDKRDYLYLAMCALFGVIINQLFFVKGISLTEPMNASVIMTTTPIMVLIVSALILKEKITLRKGIGILLGFLGAFMLFTNGGKEFSGDLFRGDIFIFINALAYGIYLVVVKKMMVKYKPLTVVKWIFTFGCFVVVPAGWVEFGAIDWAVIPQLNYIAIGYIIIFTTFLAYLLNAWALGHVSPSVVGYYIYLQPINATIIAVIFRGDVLTWDKVLFACIIFAGVFLVSYQKKEKQAVDFDQILDSN